MMKEITEFLLQAATANETWRVCDCWKWGVHPIAERMGLGENVAL